jgi:hypothetical protein
MGTQTTEPWDPSGFWDAVNESCALAAELRYIDLAVEWLEDPARTVGDEETYGSTESIPITLGWTYPVHITLRRPSTFVTQGYVDGLTETLQGFVDQGASWAQAEFSGYGSKVQDAALPLASAYENLAQRLNDDVADALTTTIPEELSTSLNLGIEEFWGSTAETFRTEYVDRFGEARENQIWVAKASGVISAAAGGIIKQAQHSLMNLMCTGRDTLKTQLMARPSQHSGVVELSTVLVLAANAAELLGVFKLPDAVEEALGVTSTMIGFAQQGVDHADTREFEAKTAEEIVSHLQSETTTVMSRYDAHWADLQSERVQTLDAAIAGMPTDKPFYPPRPALADGADPDDFYYENSPRHNG